MITLICLWWIGCQLSAPTWYYVLLGVGFILQIINFGLRMYKLGTGKEQGMKCICGFEQPNDFDLVSATVSVGNGVVGTFIYNGLYFCPICGTVRTKSKKELLDKILGEEKEEKE